MMSNEEMVRNVFRRTDEYFQKKEKRNNKIKKGASFMSLFSIITLAGLGLWSSTAQNEAVPDIPEQISIIETVSSTEETTTMESAVSTYEISESTSEAIVTHEAVTTGAETVGIVTQIYKAENTTAPVTTTVTTVVPLAEETVTETTAVTTDETTVSTDTAAQTTESATVGTEMTAVTTLESEICQDTRIWTGEVDGTYGDLTYIVCNYSDGDCIEILSCEKDAVSVEIPEEIEGLPVRFINREAFLDCADLKSVILSESLESISHHAFWGCHSLEYLYIPKNVTYIGAHSFVGCTSLKNIDVDPENEYYESDNGVLFTKGKEYLICYPTNHEGKEYVVPDTVTWIDGFSFYGNPSLTSVILPEGLEHIAGEAFKHCTGLTSIEIPDSVVGISGRTFYGCTNLTSVKLPYGATGEDSWENMIGVYAFSNCSSLKSITIPETYECILDLAFVGCTSLESIIIENPICEIWGEEETLPENTVIYGYSNSKAQEYAETYGRKFVALDEMPAAETGDIDGNGTVDISDATAVLSMYAESAAGISPAIYTSAASDPADVNGDGIVSLDDATAILLYYAQTASGFSPEWADIINK